MEISRWLREAALELESEIKGYPLTIPVKIKNIMLNDESELSEGLGERFEPATRLEHDNYVVNQRVQQKLIIGGSQRNSGERD